MNELDNGMNYERPPNWSRAIARGVVTCVLAAMLLSVFAGFFFPGFLGDDRSMANDLIGIGVWVVSIGLGGWEVFRHRPKA